jgi:hypothetical protein
MKKKSSLPLLLVMVIINSCSGNFNSATTDKITLNSTAQNSMDFSDLENEYTFNTKELTESYLKRKLEYWTNPVNGSKLVKEVAYAGYKYQDLFCELMIKDSDLYMAVNDDNIPEISARKSLDPNFKQFIESCIPPVIIDSRVNTYTPGEQFQPAIAMDNNGDFVVTWTSGNDSGATQDGNGYGIYAQRYDSTGNPAGTEFRVNSYTTYRQFYPTVAMDNDGDFVIAWMSMGQEDFSNNGYGIYAQRYDSNGNIVGTEFLVNTFTTGQQWLPSAAMDADGDFVITWMSPNQDGALYGIFAQRYDSAGNPDGSEFNVNTFTTNDQRNPAVAMDDAGDFIITWNSYGQAEGPSDIYAQRYDSTGTPDGSEFRVNTFTTTEQKIPAVGMDANGDFVIAWMGGNYGGVGQDGSDYGIYAQRYNSGGQQQGTEFRVNTFTTHNQASPSVAMANNGSFVVTWNSYRQLGFAGAQEIYAQRYDSSGAPAGGEFLVDTFTTHNQEGPAVAMDIQGDFVITWNSLYQDGARYGVYDKRYNSSGVPQ